MYKNILIPVEFDKEDAIDRAVEFAGKIADDAAVIRFLHVVHDTPAIVSQFLPEDFEQKATIESLNKLKGVGRARDLGNLTTDFVVRHGGVYHEILQMAADEAVDLIIICSHKPLVEDYLLGSNASRVVRHAKCAVMIMR